MRADATNIEEFANSEKAKTAGLFCKNGELFLQFISVPVQCLLKWRFGPLPRRVRYRRSGCPEKSQVYLQKKLDNREIKSYNCLEPNNMREVK
ncbi:DUF6144 family protein [Diplocloster modestus]|uniref:DUF6144 family protein n=1 Tax=Diplocloster modestus TaxID=2850322 RepID=UPI002FE6F0E5